MGSRSRTSSNNGDVPQNRRVFHRLHISVALVVLLAATLLLIAASPTLGLASGANTRPALFRSPASDNSRGADFLQQVLTKPKRQSTPPKPHADSICRPTGQIEDASCD